MWGPMIHMDRRQVTHGGCQYVQGVKSVRSMLTATLPTWNLKRAPLWPTVPLEQPPIRFCGSFPECNTSHLDGLIFLHSRSCSMPRFLPL